MPRRVASPDLVAFTEHLLYDIQLFFREGRTLTRSRLGLSPPLQWEIEMALVESFALHARSFVDFFFRDQGRRDDALAAHFFSDNHWTAIRPAPGPWIAEVKHPDLDRVGKEIAHLTYHRITLGERVKGWPIAQIAGAIGYVLRVFLENVPAHNVTDEFLDRAWREIPVFVRVTPASVSAAPVWPRPIETRPPKGT
jgi:hypothetical protein